MNKQREGFWFSTREPWFPKPVPSVDWPGRDAFVAKLRKLESTLEPAAYRGVSPCRLCDKTNGNEEYTSGRWTWPSGFLHYIVDHGVRPSLAFEEFVVGDLKASAQQWEEHSENVGKKKLWLKRGMPDA